MARSTRRHPDDGFTLVEILIVILIVGLLAGVAIPVFQQQRRKAVDSSLRADLRHLAIIEQTYRADYPDTGAATAAQLQAAGFKATRGNLIYLGLNPTVGAFCFGATSSRDSTGGTQWIFYDSAAGGLLRNGQHSPNVTAAQQGGVACAPGLTTVEYISGGP